MTLRLKRSQCGNVRATHIVATLGPKTSDVDSIRDLLEAGVDILRFNFSHGTHEYFERAIGNARAAEASLHNKVAAIALDIQGPKIRTGIVAGPDPNASFTVEKGAEVVLTTDPAFRTACGPSRIFVDYEALPRTPGLRVGGTIFMNDGLLGLEVLEVRRDRGEVLCRARNTASLSSHKGVNMPGASVLLPAISEKDKQDLRFGVKQGVDMVFASFIRNGSQVQEIRDFLCSCDADGGSGSDASGAPSSAGGLGGPRGHGSRIKIISKVENEEGLINFDEVLAASDGVMVARGDMGIEIPPAKVFSAQKMMIKKCNLAGKPVITATQMLESMIQNPRPTRAEVTDVANAVLDGTDCVMLSGETANGMYPVQAVRTMAEICVEAERQVPHDQLYSSLREATPVPVHLSEAMAASAVALQRELDASCLVVLPATGRTARFVSKYRPAVPTLLLATDPLTARQALLSRGIIPFCVPKEDASVSDVQSCIGLALQKLKSVGIIASGDYAICIHSELALVPSVPSSTEDLQSVGRQAQAQQPKEGALEGPGGTAKEGESLSMQAKALGKEAAGGRDLRALGSLPDLQATDQVLSQLKGESKGPGVEGGPAASSAPSTSRPQPQTVTSEPAPGPGTEGDTFRPSRLSEALYRNEASTRVVDALINTSVGKGEPEGEGVQAERLPDFRELDEEGQCHHAHLQVLIRVVRALDLDK